MMCRAALERRGMEMLVLDVTRPDGSVLEGFLRLERERRPRDPWSLAKETKIIEALAPVFCLASVTVSKIGTLASLASGCLVPPLPGVTPPTTWVP